MRAIVVVSSAALALVACQKSPDAATSSAAVTPGAGAPAATDGPPHRRAGLWEQSFSRDGKASPVGSMRMCVDSTTEAKAMLFSHDLAARHAANSPCGAPQASRGLDGSYSFASTCPMGAGGTIVTKGVARGDFNNSYQIHLETVTSGAAYAAINGHHTDEIDGKWLGVCPSNMAPGDMELANGMKINTGKLLGAARALRGSQ